ncbi:RNA-binding protein [Cenarchaeum symbiosum A]|uniref:RNA-binding protein n=1 Tax=Cenarchaeum symbiosum (strain A) TaxID=414004 RepID=A0RUT5_CENSY|nr:RNA-binding protein [Cenarchaeum symbiosum A]
MIHLQEDGQTPRRYEEHAYVLDVRRRGRSTTVRGREGTIVTAIGEDRLTLLELLGAPDAMFKAGERVYIGKEGRKKVSSVLGKMEYGRITDSAKAELEDVVNGIVASCEDRFVHYVNSSQPLTPRVHALELLSGIGKNYLKTILGEREKKKFESFADIEERTGLKQPAALFSKRILEEVAGKARMNMFVKR